MKKEKILIISILFIIGILLMTSIVNGFALTDLNGDTPEADVQEIKTVGNKTISIASTIGSVVSVIVIIVLGIKYMLGSVEEKAEYKKTMVPYLIGAALIFAASGIASVVYRLALAIK